jgi:hypothetical protein
MTESSEPELLLCSVSEYWEIIDRLLLLQDSVNPVAICEIGLDRGTTTRRLLEWITAHERELWCIDPEPPVDIDRACSESGRATVIRRRSPAALGSIHQMLNFWIIDADHNYWSITQELATIHDQHLERLEDGGVVLVHDVGWPWARRDMYYDPSALPPDAVHLHSWKLGVQLGNPRLTPSGLRGEGAFAPAIDEGGAHNGVLTGVEEFLARHPDTYEFALVPLFFGLGIIWTSRHRRSAAIREACAPFDMSRLLQRAETNRLALYLAVLDRDCALRSQFLIAKQDRARSAEDLREVFDEIRDRDELIRRELRSLLNSRWIRLLSLFERPIRKRRPGLGSVSDRLSRLIQLETIAKPAEGGTWPGRSEGTQMQGVELGPTENAESPPFDDTLRRAEKRAWVGK